MTVLVVVEHDNDRMLSQTSNLVSAAKNFNSEIWAIVIGNNCSKVTNEAKKLSSISRILVVDDVTHKNLFAEDHANQINEILKKIPQTKAVLMSTSSLGKETIPRLAALQNSTQISDVTKIFNENEFERPIYAGNLVSRIHSSEKVKFLTIRPTKFDSVGKQDCDVIEEIVTSVQNQYRKQLISKNFTETGRPDLSSAKVVISGGRGLGSAENFDNILGPLAKKFNGALGASRAAVDAGYAPNDFQVGQTGKIVAPEIYFAIGLSGSIQHLAGMKDSKIIVAINKDPNAPIFEVASIGLVADLFEVIPELTSKL